MKNDIPAFDEIQKVRETLMEMSYKHWYYEDFLSLNWWFLLLSSLLPYFIWWKVVNKRRIFEIFTYGLLCGMTACVLDVMGVDMLLWAYPDKLFSLVPPLLPADLVIIPVT
jgi:hypothetical protein